MKSTRIEKLIHKFEGSILISRKRLKGKLQRHRLKKVILQHDF